MSVGQLAHCCAQRAAHAPSPTLKVKSVAQPLRTHLLMLSELLSGSAAKTNVSKSFALYRQIYCFASAVQP